MRAKQRADESQNQTVKGGLIAIPLLPTPRRSPNQARRKARGLALDVCMFSFQTRWGRKSLPPSKRTTDCLRDYKALGLMNMTTEHQLKLNAIFISGLALSDRARIEAIGFDRWLDETGNGGAADKATPPEHSPESRSARPSHLTPLRTRRSCAVCGKNFLAKRVDASFCSARCRQRISRHPRKSDCHR